MTKEQMFDWLNTNKISVQYERPTRFTREDGSTFICDFILSSNTTQFAPAESLEEAIKLAAQIK